MLIDGLACTSALDTSGERLDVAGCDIADYNNKKATVVYEHKSGAKGTALDVVGRVLYGRKLFRREDCENDRQRYWWDRYKLPCVYVICRLRVGVGNPAADALAGEIREAKRHGEPALVGFSVEGKTIDSDQGVLKYTVCRDLAITYRSANRTCAGAEILQEEPPAMTKHELARLPGGVELPLADLELSEDMLPPDLLKTMAAEGGDVAPAQAVGGVALQKRAQDRPEALPAPAVAPATVGTPPLTVRGQPVQPTPQVGEPRLDETTGTLHAPEGAFKLYLPRHDGTEAQYDQILNDPKVSEFHDRAMEGWTRAHALLKQHELPSEVVMHAVLFSNMSPNTPVPLQEMMYSKLVDSMRHTGHDPSKPGFGSTIQHWMTLNRPDLHPEHAGDYFKEHPGIHTKAGAVHSYGLPENKANNIVQYHQMHDALVNMLQQHGTNGRAFAGALMGFKLAGQKHEQRRATMVRQGKPDPGPYLQGFLAVHGLAPKTARYAAGMMGAGNALVPDTHFIRHMFGLDRKQDKATIERLKAHLWNEHHGHVLEGMDRWYAKNHPAVRHMMQHPKWGKHFETAEDAIFPAFWKHWMTIIPHEKLRGMTTGGKNEYTDHVPYWRAIDPFTKAEGSGGDLPLQTSILHRKYVEHLGETPAAMLFAAHLLPRLLDQGERRVQEASPQHLLGTAPHLEGLVTDLKGMLRKSDGLWPGGPRIKAVGINDGPAAGRVMIMGGHLHHLEDYHGMLRRLLPSGEMTPDVVARLHALEAHPGLTVTDDHELPQETEAEAEGEDPQAPGASAALQMPPPRQTEAYRYRRQGAENDSTLEVSGDHAMLDGVEIPMSLVELMMHNVEAGAATLEPVGLTKMESGLWILDDLMKADMDPAEALQHVRAAVKAGHIHPDVERAMTRHIYNDKMLHDMPIGNSYAYSEFKKTPRPGVHVALDMNGMKAINDTHGHQAGDDAIRSYFGAVRSAVDESVGRDKAKVFRNPAEYNVWRHGGDEGQVYLPSHEHALKFAHTLREKMDALPAVGGTHKLSAAVGIGADPASADKALYHAKAQKKLPSGEQRWAPGQVPMLAHSLTPGKEGVIALHSEAPPSMPHPVTTPTGA